MRGPAKKMGEAEIAEDTRIHFRDIVELVECEDFATANKFLDGTKKGKWILLKIYMNTVQHYANTPDGVKTFQKFIKIYVLGRIEKI